MAERITEVRCQAFRAARDEMTIPLPNGVSLVVLGENGVGKSTIADAIEFYFCGAVESQRREGRALLNHVEADVSATRVSIGATGILGGTAGLAEDARARRIPQGETFILRGPTLSAFVEMTKGEKWRYLFEILGLGPLDELRRDLQTAATLADREVQAAEGRLNAAKSALSNHAPSVNPTSVLSQIQELAARASVTVPETLNDALKSDWASAATTRRLIERAARREQLVASVRVAPTLPSVTFLKAWNRTLTGARSADHRRSALVRAASPILQMYGKNECPLCGQAIPIEKLRDRIEEEIKRLRPGDRQVSAAEGKLRGVVGAIRTAWAAREAIVSTARVLGVPVPSLPHSPEALIEEARAGQREVDIARVESSFRDLAAWDLATSKAVREDLPDVGPADRALVELVRLIGLTQSWVEADQKFRLEKKVADVAAGLHREYVTKQNAFFSDVLNQISARAAQVFAKLHPGEELANISLEQWGDKGLELAVDFHGRRHRPPHRILSESHLHSLGIALFLAMAETFNERLRVLVLDDIVNSFDARHRGELAQVLATEYRDWQLIVLTHDRVFFEQLSRWAPAWKKIQITSCTYEEGPRLTGYIANDFFGRARELLRDGDPQGAAAKCRRALEEVLQEACEGMEAELPHRRGYRNDRRDATEWLKGVRRGLKRHNFRPDPLLNLLHGVEVDFQSVLNIEVHANDDWASTQEIEAALRRAETLNLFWQCPECETSVWLRGSAGDSSCKCGEMRFPHGMRSEASTPILSTSVP